MPFRSRPSPDGKPTDLAVDAKSQGCLTAPSPRLWAAGNCVGLAVCLFSTQLLGQFSSSARTNVVESGQTRPILPAEILWVTPNPALTEPGVHVRRSPGDALVTATNGMTLWYGAQLTTAQEAEALLQVGSLTYYLLQGNAEVVIQAEVDAPSPAAREPATPIEGEKGWFEKVRLRLERGWAFVTGESGGVVYVAGSASASTGNTSFEIGRIPERDQSVFTVDSGSLTVTRGGSIVPLAGGEGSTNCQVLLEGTNAPVVKSASATLAKGPVQWWIYYPAVLNVDDLQLATADGDLNRSLAAYRSGRFRDAVRAYAPKPEPTNTTHRAYLAALRLVLGDVESAQRILATLPSDYEPANALRTLIKAISGETRFEPRPPTTASELTAYSYLLQSRLDLAGARDSAEQATKKSKDFGLGWVRVAQLRFAEGEVVPARRAAETATNCSPFHAEAHSTLGFILAAANKPREAEAAFERAIELDPSVADGWLGRGLCRIRWRDAHDGISDLQIAVAVEPRRALLRGYLGKAFQLAWNEHRAREEFDLAKFLDPGDPTSWLYSALLHQEQNRINPAIVDMEESVRRNDNRRLFRSRLFLDEDLAIRSANLASIYRDAGMVDVSLREAATAVTHDYANSSAHQFLADSYNALRDPTRFNLRYETLWFNEWLLANLMAPTEASSLSQHPSRPDYSRLLARDHLGLYSTSEYRSDGQLRQTVSQFGYQGTLAWSVDLDLQQNDGVRPNNELERFEASIQLKQQLTLRDSVLGVVRLLDFDAEDNFQYTQPSREYHPDYRFEEEGLPGMLLAGYHREWSPGVHTTLLAGRLADERHFTDEHQEFPILGTMGDMVVAPFPDPAIMTYDFEHNFEVYSVELNQIYADHHNTLNLGGRYQFGEFSAHSQMQPSEQWMERSRYTLSPDILNNEFTEDMRRGSLYAYYTRTFLDTLHVTAGVAYNTVTFPRNDRNLPVVEGQDTEAQWSPKAALVWRPWNRATLRAAYSRTLGGVNFDESVRLEPAQLAGFGQAYRSVIPESLVGSVAAPTFEVMGLAVDFKLPCNIYYGLEVERIDSEVDQALGAITVPPQSMTLGANSRVRESIDYREQRVGFTLNHLVDDEWSIGCSYHFTRSEISQSLHDDRAGDLHRLAQFIRFNHPSGLFAVEELSYYIQNNEGYDPGTAEHEGDHFPMLNVGIGYRLRRQAAAITLSLLNLTDEDYQLNPLTPYAEMPRERAFQLRLELRF